MLKKKYILTILITVLVLTANQIYIQHCLSLKEKDAELINKAGKQRMYSQKILHLYEHWHITGVEPEMLSIDIDNWKTSNDYLLEQNFLTTEQEKEILRSLDEIIEEQKAITQTPPTTRTIKEMNLSSSYFLLEMDNLVNIYENLAAEKLSRIRAIEVFLYSISLLIVLGEILFVFYPLIRTLTQQSLALNKSLDKLKQHKNELEQLTYAISHDLQEPISLVESLIMRSKRKQNNTFHISDEMMELLELQIKKANKLLSDLLLYTGSKIKRTKESFDLKELVEENLAHLNSNENIEFAALKNLKVYGYKNDISLVIEHMLINAITYKSENRDLQIKISQEIEDQFYVVKIKDNGKGIDPTKTDSVFNLFKRLELNKHNVSTGFGLAFCKKIIEDHGGYIGVYSEQNHGSEFYFKLPKNT